VPLQYDPPQAGALRQGEILGDIWDHVPQYPPIESQPNQSFTIESIYYEFVVVMSPDCDLEWDFKARFPDQESQNGLIPLSHSLDLPPLLSHVFLAAAYRNEKIRSRKEIKSDIWRRIENNQDERFHHFAPATLNDTSAIALPDLYIDFKKALAIPTKSLYEGLRVQGVKRIALIPDKYIHDLMHRYYGFLSRVALPDP
jgi:hypothetical protein